MENLNLQVMLQDGSFADFEVQTERDSKIYTILEKGEALASFKAIENGEWALESNPGQIDGDLQDRITKQLNGYRVK